MKLTFLIILIPLIYLQKIGLPLGGDQQVSITVFPFYAGVAFGLYKGVLKINLARLLLYVVLLGAMIASQLMSGVVFSPLGLILILTLYLPFVTEARISAAQYRELSEVFQNLMIIPCAAVFVQLAFEFASGFHTLSLEALVPKPLLMSGFFYEAPYHFGQPFVRANGFFMLEPSFIAMFAAAALIVEVSLRRRPWRLALYAGALIASLGATGYLMMAVALPFLLARLPAKVSVAVGVLVLVGVVGAVATGAADALLNRVVELGTPGTSGYGRVTQPFEQLLSAAALPQNLVTGIGAGNIEKGPATWPLVRLALEYGFVAAVIFLALELMLSVGAPVAALSISLFVIFNFTVILIFTTVACVRVSKPRRAPAWMARSGLAGVRRATSPAPARAAAPALARAAS